MGTTLRGRRTWSCLVLAHLARHQNFDDLDVSLQAGFTTVGGNRREKKRDQTTRLVNHARLLGWLNLMVIQA